MRLNIEVRDRKWKRKRFHNCFVASEAVDWLVEVSREGVCVGVSCVSRLMVSSLVFCSRCV